MGIRHNAREWAVQFLFQTEFNREDVKLDKALELFWNFQDQLASMDPADSMEIPADGKSLSKARVFAEELIRGVISKHREIDALIEKFAANWDVERIGTVERNVMRLAIYEMLYRTDIPPVVSINEAVDLAKAFSSTESGKFVNGILDRIRADLKRDARKVDNPRPSPPSLPLP